MAEKTNSAKKGPSFGRLAFWAVVLVLALVTGWQYYAKQSYDSARIGLKKAIEEHDQLDKKGLLLAEADALCKSSKRIGPIDQKVGQVVVHCFNGPIRSYFVRLHVKKVGDDVTVEEFDTESTIPEPVK